MTRKLSINTEVQLYDYLKKRLHGPDRFPTGQGVRRQELGRSEGYMTRKLSIATEVQLYAYLKKRQPRADWQRIETGVGTGIPDINVFLRDARQEWWLELKVARQLADVVVIKWRKAQRAWGLRRQMAGGNVALAIWLPVRQCVVLMEPLIWHEESVWYGSKTSELWALPLERVIRDSKSIRYLFNV